MRRLKALILRACALRRDRQGTIMIEAAFSLPLMILLLLGGFETSQYILAHQKLNRIASTMSDTIAQSSQTLSARQMHDLLNSVNFMASPFNMAVKGRVIVTAVTGNAGVNQVMWRRCAGGLSQTSQLGSPAVLPGSAILPPGSTAVITEAYIDYAPLFATDLFRPSRLRQTVLYRTRVGALPTGGPTNDIVGTLPGMAVSATC
jgi:TadE-like protein